MREVRRHGTTTGYRYGCRCSDCTAANATSRYEYYYRHLGAERARQRAQDVKEAAEQPERRRKRMYRTRLRERYGMSPEQWDALVINQLGCCAACGDQLDDESSPCVDHCHDTGAVRGILCRRCNTAEGMLRSDPDRALRLAAYLLATSNVIGVLA